MKEHSVRPRKSANRLDFIRRANRSELRRLCDADGVHHVPVQLHLLREKFFCLAQVDLSVIGFRQKQLGSPSVELRGASFVRLDVGTLVTDHAVKRLAKLGETKRVCRSTGKHKINIAIDFENLPDAFATLRGPFVISVRGCITGIRLLQSYPCFGTNRRRVITSKMVTNRVAAHRSCTTRVLSTDNRTKRLPDSGALGLRICQANPSSICSSNCVQQFHFLFRKERVG